MLEAFYIRVINNSKEGYAESEALYPILADVCARFDIKLSDSTDYKSVGVISNQIAAALDKADVIFADGNSTNENVWYEIGYSDRIHVAKVICLAREGRVFPFDRAAIRAIRYYDPHQDQLHLQRALSDAVETIICSVNVRSLFGCVDREDFAQLVCNKLDSPNLRALASRWLLNKCRDTDTEIFERQHAVRTLGALGVLPDVIPVLVQRSVDDRVRQVVYSEIGKLRSTVHDSAWLIDESHLEKNWLLLAFATAAARHWLDGYLSDALFRERIGHGSDPRVREALIDAIIRQRLVAAKSTA